MFLSLDSGVNTIIISIIIFVIIVFLAYDLSELYLESRNEFLDEPNKEKSDSGMVKAEPEDGRN